MNVLNFTPFRMEVSGRAAAPGARSATPAVAAGGRCGSSDTVFSTLRPVAARTRAQRERNVVGVTIGYAFLAYYTLRTATCMVPNHPVPTRAHAVDPETG